MEIKLRREAVQIKDSYQISKKEFDEILEKVEKMGVLNRSRKSLRFEWAAHNLLYNLGIRREKTGSVDFDFVQSTWDKIRYEILGRISLLFIR